MTRMRCLPSGCRPPQIYWSLSAKVGFTPTAAGHAHTGGALRWRVLRPPSATHGD